MSPTVTPTSSNVSRSMACSSVSPGSTKPANSEKNGAGNVGLRASRTRPLSRSISVMIAGASRGKATSPQLGQRRYCSPRAGSVAVAHWPQKRWVRSQSTSWAACPVRVQVTSSSVPHSSRQVAEESHVDVGVVPHVDGEAPAAVEGAEEQPVAGCVVVDHEDRPSLVHGHDQGRTVGQAAVGRRGEWRKGTPHV